MRWRLLGRYSNYFDISVRYECIDEERVLIHIVGVSPISMQAINTGWDGSSGTITLSCEYSFVLGPALCDSKGTPDCNTLWLINFF